jgi:hypothetical protein
MHLITLQLKKHTNSILTLISIIQIFQICLNVYYGPLNLTTYFGCLKTSVALRTRIRAEHDLTGGIRILGYEKFTY